MKNVILAIVGLIILGSIGFGIWFFISQKSGGNLQEVFALADSMEIVFTPEGENTSYKKVVTHQPQVWLLTGTISAKKAPAVKCGYHGTVQFFAKGKPLFSEPAAFNVNPKCQHVAFLYKEKVQRRVLLNEGANYLRDLLEEIKKEQSL